MKIMRLVISQIKIPINLIITYFTVFKYRFNRKIKIIYNY